MTYQEYQTILRNDLTSFVQRSFYELNPQGIYLSSPYIELICSKLEACRRGDTTRQIFNLPPRTLKSHIGSVVYPAWLLGHDPTKHILCASYGQDLADKHARDCRTLMASPFYRSLFPHTRLAAKQSVGEFMTSRLGGRLSTSVGGTVTGRGADYIIQDDVMKPEDAHSEARRRVTNEWQENTLLSRFNSKKKGVMVIVAQRLHEDDVVGHVLERGDHWDVLSLPAIAQEDENIPYDTPFGPAIFTRTRGTALHPERDSLETLLKVRREIGEYTFESQYQQSPQPLDGGVIKRSWIRHYKRGALPERFSYILQSWDTANKTGELNDYSVCTTWGLYGGYFYLLDVFRKRLNYPDLKRAVADQWRLHNPTRVLIEDKSSGIPLIQELRAEGIFGVEAYKPAPGSDKLLRLHAQSIKFESGKVFLPSDAPWLDEYERELTGFPGGKYDDQVDSTTQALEFLGTTGSTAAMWEALGR
jgi:predicted phage terminase large subunit-like protein